MKLEQLEAAEREDPRAEKKVGSLTVIGPDRKMVYLMDPFTGDVQARAFGPVKMIPGSTRDNVPHGMGAVRD